jgi:hypothetical protein
MGSAISATVAWFQHHTLVAITTRLLTALDVVNTSAAGNVISVILEKGKRAYVRAPNGPIGWDCLVLDYFDSEHDDQCNVGFRNGIIPPSFAIRSFYIGWFVPSAYVHRERRRQQ